MKWIAVSILTIKTIKEAMKASNNYDGFLFMAYPTVIMWAMILGGIE
jgi:hypothetical protein